jgi:hypothetical protein
VPFDESRRPTVDDLAALIEHDHRISTGLERDDLLIGRHNEIVMSPPGTAEIVKRW